MEVLARRFGKGPAGELAADVSEDVEPATLAECALLAVEYGGGDGDGDADDCEELGDRCSSVCHPERPFPPPRADDRW